MKKTRTAPYRFRIGAQSAKFRRVYDDELGRLRLAHRITELREKCGLTQAQLADKVGTTQAGISRLENPNYRNYSLTTLEKVAAALGARLRVELEERRRQRRNGPNGSGELPRFGNSRNVEMCVRASGTRQQARVRICGRGSPMRAAAAGSRLRRPCNGIDVTVHTGGFAMSS